MRTILLAAALLSGCSLLPTVVTQKEKAECTVPLAAVEPVPARPKLLPGATNEDMKKRMDALEGDVAKANQRLADVPKTINTNPVKPEPEPGIWDRLRNIF